MATKSKRVTVGKRELQQTANAVEDIAIQEGVIGLDQAKEGLNKLEAGREVSNLGRGALAVGAATVTRGADEIAVAEGLSRISTVVAAAGIVDVAQGAELLEKSEDVEIQSEMVGFLSESDLEHAMGIAAIAGQMQVVADIVALRDMPVLVAFLEAKGNALHQLAVETVIKFAAGRAVAQSMAETAARVGEMGVNEVEEGMTRVGVAERAAAVSDVMAASGAQKVVQGAVEIEAGQELVQAGQALALEGVADVAAGAEMVGQAEALDATAGALMDRAE
jgi:hypothetical protein